MCKGIVQLQICVIVCLIIVFGTVADITLYPAHSSQYLQNPNDTIVRECMDPQVLECFYKGLLTPRCVQNYLRVYVTKIVPSRMYKYFHETLTDDQRSDDEDPEVRFRIVGGSRVSITDVPYAVLYGLWCGGALIAPEWVITAAHCKEKETFVQAGSSRRSQGTRYNICAHFTHPFWNTTKKHSHDWDYQLVLLDRPVPVTPSSRPIAIGALNDIVPNDLVGITGWGHVHYKDKMQDYVRRVFVPVMEHEVCRYLPHKNYRNITPRMFCAGLTEGSRDSCQGDSGGPAVSRGKLVGLVSFGVGCAGPEQPGVYAVVPAARAWIRFITALPL